MHIFIINAIIRPIPDSWIYEDTNSTNYVRVSRIQVQMSTKIFHVFVLQFLTVKESRYSFFLSTYARSMHIHIHLHGKLLQKIVFFVKILHIHFISNFVAKAKTQQMISCVYALIINYSSLFFYNTSYWQFSIVTFWRSQLSLIFKCYWYKTHPFVPKWITQNKSNFILVTNYCMILHIIILFYSHRTKPLSCIS